MGRTGLVRIDENGARSDFSLLVKHLPPNLVRHAIYSPCFSKCTFCTFAELADVEGKTRSNEFAIEIREPFEPLDRGALRKGCLGLPRHSH